MFRQTIFVILTRNISIRIHILIPRWLREIALKENTIRFISIVLVRFISIVLVQQQLLKWELFYN